jgi:hypothetical protein
MHLEDLETGANLGNCDIGEITGIVKPEMECLRSDSSRAAVWVHGLPALLRKALAPRARGIFLSPE